MKKDRIEVLITITGTHMHEEEEDTTVELFTTGVFYQEGESFYIAYEESEATGYGGCETTLHVEGDQRVTLTRTGPVETHLVVQKGVRHQGLYDVGFGDMMIGVNGLGIETNLTDKGGHVMFHYLLDVDSITASENKMTIDIKEREPSAAE